MLSNLWIRNRKDNWNRLETLLRQVENSGIRSLSPVELREMGLLYRQAAADLSAARNDPASKPIEQYLNRLVGRAHNYVYSGNRVSALGVWNFMAHGYPRLLRRLSRYVVLSTAIFALALAVGVVIQMARPDFASYELGPAMMNKIEHHQMWTDEILSAKPQAASGIMTNNIFVCCLTFAAGIFAGLGTVYLLIQNGISIGVITVVCAQHKMALSVLSFMAAHGALEIPSILFSGAAGLRLGAGILFPGQLRRRDAIAVAGIEAVQLLSGCIPLLVVAGCFEGFLSPTAAPLAVKFGVCLVLFTGLCYWLMEGGRRPVHAAEIPATASPAL
jgi:uncharacterized membrane protein SpoIIM required for sporulation